MRIVTHFVSSLSTSSGVMSVIMNYYRYINRSEIQFNFIYFSETEMSYSKEIKELGGNIYFINSPALNKKYIGDLCVLLKRLSASSEIFHNHEVSLTLLLSPIVKKCGFTKIISHSHSTQFSDKPLNSFRNMLMCLPINKLVDFRFACSNLAAIKYYGKKRTEKGEVIILKNSINCEDYSFSQSIRDKIRHEYELDGRIVIGHIGRFKEQKNHEFLIEIFKEINTIDKTSILMLVGDGPLEERIKNKVNQLELENNVIFLGRRLNVNELLQAMDVLVLPSLFEGLPVIGVEAQAAGLPCVFSSSITNEVNILDNEFVDLDQSPRYWAKKIIEQTKKNRGNTLERLKERGYDIKQASLELDKIYLSM